MRGCGQPLVKRTAFVGLNVGEAKVAQPFHRHDVANSLPDQREHPPWPGVEEQWCAIDDEVLVERDTPGPSTSTGVLMR